MHLREMRTDERAQGDYEAPGVAQAGRAQCR